jgi:hypothetical protein
MSSLENGPDIEMVSIASESLGDTLDVWDNDRALLHSIPRRTVASRWLHYGVNEFLCVFVKHQIMSYLPNFLVEILLILTYDLGSTDQTMNDSPFHVRWVIGFEVQITTTMSRFPVHFFGQFRTPLHEQDLQERKIIISFNFHSEFDGKSEVVGVVKQLLQSCWSMCLNHENFVDVSELFSWFIVRCIQSYFVKIFHKYITDHRR